MYYLEVKLRSGNWATVKGAKSLDEVKKCARNYYSDFEWNIYLKQDVQYEPFINIISSNDRGAQE